MMSDTETRSVAEILGWRLVPSSDPTIWPPWWLGPTGERSDTMPEPTVDDMLAWLGGQGYALSILTWPKAGSIDVRVTTDFGMTSWNEHGSTLLEALEAAVRAVARNAT
jgi:hypothetical protein